MTVEFLIYFCSSIRFRFIVGYRGFTLESHIVTHVRKPMNKWDTPMWNPSIANSL